MKNKLILLSLFIQIFFTGCATPYQKLSKNGGYSDKKISDRIYVISFQGNAKTSDEVVHKYFLRRCAEITLENHFSYFVVIEKKEKSRNIMVTSEGTVETKAKLATSRYSGITSYAPTEYKNITEHKIEGKIALFKENEEPLNALKAQHVLKDVEH